MQDFDKYFQLCKKYKQSLEKLLAHKQINLLCESNKNLITGLLAHNLDNLEEIASQYKLSVNSVIETYFLGIFIEKVVEYQEKESEKGK